MDGAAGETEDESHIRAGLLLAVSDQRGDNAALLKFLATHLENIKKLPDKQQTDLSSLVKALVWSNVLQNAGGDGPKSGRAAMARPATRHALVASSR